MWMFIVLAFAVGWLTWAWSLLIAASRDDDDNGRG